MLPLHIHVIIFLYLCRIKPINVSKTLFHTKLYAIGCQKIYFLWHQTYMSTIEYACSINAGT